MSGSAFARLPEPPYYAVIFSSQRTPDDNGYGAMAQRMADLAREQPGFLGMESTRGADGFGITVAYFTSEADIAAWKANAEHRVAQRLGHSTWYAHFELRVAKVERAYGGPGGPAR
jgi:heme-degrading monooxygenase HmoA